VSHNNVNNMYSCEPVIEWDVDRVELFRLTLIY